MRQFIAQVARFEPGNRYTGGSAGILDPGEIATKELPRLQGGQFFAYLFRRFGYPTTGWDGYKQLVNYIITTPQDGLFLTISPYLARDAEDMPSDDMNVRLMFGYLMEEEQEKGIFRQQLGLGMKRAVRSPLTVQANKALKITIKDLLRPVNIRDYLINCYGAVSDDPSRLPKMTEYYHAAGYPVLGDFYQDTDRLMKFYSALKRLGAGGYSVGMQRVIDFAGNAAEVEEGVFMGNTQQLQQTRAVVLDEESLYQINTRIGTIRNEVYVAGKKGLIDQSLATKCDAWMAEIVAYLEAREHRIDEQLEQ